MPRRRRHIELEAPVVPEAIEAPPVVEEVAPVDEVIPVKPDLRAEYERLVKLVHAAKRGTKEFADLMERKRQAFIAWHSSK